MRARHVVFGLVAWVGVVMLGGACSLLYSLDGFDRGPSGGDAGEDGPALGGSGVGGAASTGSTASGGGLGGRDAGLDAAPDGPTNPCAGQAEGTPCGSPDACHQAACTSGMCVTSPKADGASCPDPDSCHAGACKAGACVAGTAKPDGTMVGGSATNRCCSGNPTDVTTNGDCGVCGMKCGSGQSCKPQGSNPTAYVCTGCANNGGNAACFSGCCATSLDPAGVCSPSSCMSNHCCSTGAQGCPSGTCQWFQGDKNNYCTYEHMNEPNQC